MTAQELKNSILQLAVQGKLVPQCKDDEPASELLIRISKERSLRIKNGALVIDKKHTAEPITEEDIPYDIPDSWEWVRFADLVTFYSGKTPQRQNPAYWNNCQYPWISIADMQDGSIISSTKESISEQALKECFAGKLSPAGTMIMSFKLTIGKISILGFNAVHNEAIISIFPTVERNDEEIIKSYLFKILPSIAVMGDSKNAVKGKTLNATSISNLMIPLPPLAEQKRIVEKIEELMPLIEEYGKAEEQLSKLNAEFPDKLRKSILQQAVQGKLTERDPADEPASELLKRIKVEKEALIKAGKIKKEKPLPAITDDEKPFDIPDTWEWVRLSEVIDVRDGTHDTPKYLPNGYPLITGKDFYNGYFELNKTQYISKEDYEEIIKRSKVDVGDILFSMIGGNIGSMIRISEENYFDMAIKNVALFKQYVKSETLSYYLFYFLQSQIDRMRKSAKGGAQPFVPLNLIRSYPFPLPPLAEQKRIVKRVEELLALCDELKY